MTEKERNRKSRVGIHVLGRRELEDYLYDPKVLTTFMESQGCDADTIQEILASRENLLKAQSGPPNIKDASGQLLCDIRKITGLPNLGRTRNEFALDFLVPALKKTQSVFAELREDVFGLSTHEDVA